MNTIYLFLRKSLTNLSLQISFVLKTLDIYARSFHKPDGKSYIQIKISFSMSMCHALFSMPSSYHSLNFQTENQDYKAQAPWLKNTTKQAPDQKSKA